MKPCKPPVPVWSGLLLACGLERWEVFRLAHLNQQAADDANLEAWRAREKAQYGPKKEWQIQMKRAIEHERFARQRSERAQQLRKLAEQIPYVDPYK